MFWGRVNTFWPRRMNSFAGLVRPCLHGIGSKRIQIGPVRKSDRIGLLFTRDRSGTGLRRIQNWSYFFTGPISDPFESVPDQFQNGSVKTEVKLILPGSVRNGSGPVPCKRNLRPRSHISGMARLLHKPIKISSLQRIKE